MSERTATATEGDVGAPASDPLPGIFGPIEPNQELKEIEGQGAYTGDARRFWNLLWLSSKQQYQMQYRNSVLGYVWTLLRPLALFAVLYFVFAKVLRYGATIPNFPLSLLLGIILFQYFADTTSAAMGAMVNNGPTMRKLDFPRIVVPLAVVVSSTMTALMNVGIALGFVLVFGGAVHTTWLLFPLAFIALGLFSTGVSLLLSTAFVFVRDIGQVWTVIIRVLFYASPIFYPLDLIPDRYQPIIALNPLAPILTEAKNWIVNPTAPGMIDLVGVEILAFSAAIALVISATGLVMFWRKAPYVAERL